MTFYFFVSGQLDNGHINAVQRCRNRALLESVSSSTSLFLMKQATAVLIILFITGASMIAGIRIVFAQENKIDSLLTLLKKDEPACAKPCLEDSGKVNHLNALAWELRFSDPDSSVALSTTAFQLAEKINWQVGMGMSDHNLGTFYFFKGDYALSLEQFFKALMIWKVLEQKQDQTLKSTVVFNLKAKTIGNIGNVYWYMGDLPSALNYLFEALKMNEKSGNKKEIATNCGNIGAVFLEKKDYSKSLTYLSKALDMDKSLKNDAGVARHLGNIGNLYGEQKNYPAALNFYFSALKMDGELGNKNGIARHSGNIGSIYSSMEKYDEALDYLLKAKEMDEALGSKEDLAVDLGNIGSVYIKTHKYSEAKKILEQSLSIAIEINSLDDIRQGNENLSEYYKETGNYQKALEYYERATAAKDSLFNMEREEDITRKEMNYEFERKSAAAKAEQDKKDAATAAEIKSQKLIRDFSITGVVATFIFAGYSFYRFRQRKKLESEQAMLNERLRISRELHDDIGSTLSSISVYSDVARNLLAKREGETEVLSRIGTASRELIDKMNDIIWSLNPGNEGFEALLNRMHAFAAQMLTPLNIAFEFVAGDDLKKVHLNMNQRKNIFLIYKEALHNIVKYARCRTVTVTLSAQTSAFMMQVKDDGTGFDSNINTSYNGNGIKNMNARAGEINGRFKVASLPGNGTLIEVTVPAKMTV